MMNPFEWIVDQVERPIKAVGHEIGDDLQAFGKEIKKDAAVIAMEFTVVATLAALESLNPDKAQKYRNARTAIDQ